MWQYLGKAIIALGLPRAIDTLFDFIAQDSAENPVEPKKENTTGRKHDTSKMTQFRYDFIMYAHEQWRIYNKDHPGNRKTAEELANVINSRLGTNKSKTTLSRIWNGRIDRESLAVGTKEFDY